MAYAANIQRQTFNLDNTNPGDTYTVATFDVHKRAADGGIAGDNPFSLFKIQVDWFEASNVAFLNAELYVNEFLLEDTSSLDFFVPEGDSGYGDGTYSVNNSTQYNKYTRYEASDSQYSEIRDWFYVSFTNLRTNDDNPDYYWLDVVVRTPNVNGGALMVDSYCYILLPI